jgi:hypothetical protein
MAPSCPDPRAVITSPGVNQIISGVVEISGTAVHEQFQYYKVEYAPGAQADAGFVYISGSDRPVLNGRLVSFDSRTVPNGTYTLRLTTIDQTGNYPPPCQVTVTVRN